MVGNLREGRKKWESGCRRRKGEGKKDVKRLEINTNLSPSCLHG